VEKSLVHLLVKDISLNNFNLNEFIEIFIGGNDTLESIDLSWNNIRGRSAIDIANGIKVFIKNFSFVYHYICRKMFD